MPLKTAAITTPTGLEYLQVDASGSVAIEDGRELEALLLPGRPHHMGFMLSRVAKGTDYSAEVRRFFPTLNDKTKAVAVVVTSPLVRAAINLMIRFSGEQGSPVRMFTSEDEAIAWLESHRG